MKLTVNLISPELEEVIASFNETRDGVTTKSYDYLDQKNTEFDEDFEVFHDLTNSLKRHIADTIEENYMCVWETAQGINFLTRFEKVIKQ
jgi:dynein heavy chain